MRIRYTVSGPKGKAIVYAEVGPCSALSYPILSCLASHGTYSVYSPCIPPAVTQISDRMESHEFVYLIVKDVRTGRVQTLEDNRDILEEKSRGGPGGGHGSSVSGGDSNPLTALLKGVGAA